jgi:hypothetical protein
MENLRVTGKGEIRFKQRYYTGDIVNNYTSGQGKQVRSDDGTTIEGTFKVLPTEVNGKTMNIGRCVEGKWTFKDGTTYE